MSKGALVTIVRLPNLIPGGKTGLDDVLRIAGPEMFKALRDASPAWSVSSGGTDQTPVIECLENIEARPVPWLWKNYAPIGMVTLLSGDPSGGKTYVALAIAAALSNGRVPYSGEKCRPVTTLYMSNENSAPYVTKPRFVAQGGNAKRFHILNGSVSSDGAQKSISLVDLSVIEQAIIKTQAGLLIIDPLQSYMGAGVDLHRSNETRPILDGIIALAERHNVCVLIIRHLAKSSGGRAIHKGLGSIDITGACRVEMLVGTAPDAPQERALIQIKNNLGMYAPSLRFEIAGKEMQAKLVWKGISTLTSVDLMAPEGGTKRKTQIDIAKDYLRDALKDGAKLVSELEDGSELPLKVLQKASTILGLAKSRKGESGQWLWALHAPAKFARGGA